MIFAKQKIDGHLIQCIASHLPTELSPPLNSLYVTIVVSTFHSLNLEI